MIGESLTDLRQRYYYRLAYTCQRYSPENLRSKVWADIVDLYLDLVQWHGQQGEGRWLAEHLVWLGQQRQLPLPTLVDHLLQVLSPTGPCGERSP